MRKPFQTGDMVILVAAKNPVLQHLLGQIHKLGPPCAIHARSWDFDPPVFAGALHRPVSWAELGMRRIDDQPGNEHWVTESRKSLPRTKDTVRITERGEVA
jgi:hypothetical protein